MGYGIGEGKYFSDQTKSTIVDLMTAQKKVLPKRVDEQIPAIPNLNHDYSSMLDTNGTQLQTVGNHWKLSQALDNRTRSRLDRRGTCLACHQEMPSEDLAVSLLMHTAKYAGVSIDNKMHKSIVNKSILLSAWVQVFGGVLFCVGFILLIRKRRV
jgi:hypothetical protein